MAGTAGRISLWGIEVFLATAEEAPALADLPWREGQLRLA